MFSVRKLDQAKVLEVVPASPHFSKNAIIQDGFANKYFIQGSYMSDISKLKFLFLTTWLE